MRKTLVKLLAIRKDGEQRSSEEDRKSAVLPAAHRSGAPYLKHAEKMPHKLSLQLLGIMAGLTLSVWGYAIGLGGIKVTSPLGQPLKAEIALLAVSQADRSGLVARLATPDTYRGAGLEYPYGLNYKFKVATRQNGEVYLKLTSQKKINDPFVSLLVELSWSSGRSMREYTFLLDPPGYVATQAKPTTVQVVAPVVVHSVAMQPENPAVAHREKRAEKPVEPMAKPVETPVVQPVTTPVAPVQPKPAVMVMSSVTVKRGDTLTKIAVQNKPDNVSLDRMLVALYRANSQQFDGKNMNRIQAGKVLHIPDQKALDSVVQADAVQEIHAQTADWNAYRQKLASAAALRRQTQATGQVSSGKITSTADDKTPIASAAAKEVLRLSKGEVKGDKSGKSKQSRHDASAEDAIANSKTEKDAQTRAALLEKNIKDMKQLTQLKAEAAALVSAAGKPAAASAVKPTVMEKPSLKDQFLASPLYMGMAAAALLALVGLGLALGRRKSAKETKPEGVELGATTGQLTSPVVPSPDTGDFTAIVADVAEVASDSDEIDPIKEADLFLNFGRDEQAEEVLKDALERTPDNHKIHLKLLSIYAQRQDAESFAQIFGLLSESGDVEAIQEAEILAQQLKPAHVSVDMDTLEDADSATQMTAAIKDEAEFDAVDFDVTETLAPQIPKVDFDVTETLAPQIPKVDFDVTETLAPHIPEVDFDVSSTNAALAALEIPDTPIPEVAFDLTLTQPSLAVPDVSELEIADKVAEQEALAQQDEAMPNLDDLIFDVMSASEAGTEAAVELPDEKTDETDSSDDPVDDGMEFTLDFPVDDVEEVAHPKVPAIDLADISLEMDTVNEPDEAEKSERWHEVATKLDLAKAYQEMGDDVGAREILDEVMIEGDAAQQQDAQLLISKLS
ncbi:MAG: FimV/HubP family polar landmark protein [Gallionella sp.]